MATKYLDDMDVVDGDIVECTGNISAPNFTVGKEYTVTGTKTLIDDDGMPCKPSARFAKCPR